jgi:protein-L-isoaspartate(D-aspartate) O-methyltransferase
MDPYQAERERMVANQIAQRGISDERVLEALRRVPRHLFVPEDARDYAYRDAPVRIGSGQTISQPYIVALMTALLKLKADHRVLDVGTGSGYQAAILGEMRAQVFTIERHQDLAQRAKELLQQLGYQNIQVVVGDGTQGLETFAPFDRILVAAAAPSVPEPLLDQLAPGGRLVIPVGGRFGQNLEIWVKQEEGFKRIQDIGVMFVPLVGQYGWKSA